MATIGTFTRDQDGLLKGQIKTLNLSAEVSMEPVESQKEGAPAYRLYAGEVELGAAWAKTAKESGRKYHQVRLDDPSFPAPIFANLARGPGQRLVRADLEPAEAEHREAPRRGHPPEPGQPLTAPSRRLASTGRGAIAPQHVSHCEACGPTPLAGIGAAAGNF